MERLSVFVQKVSKAVEELSRYFGVLFILYLLADFYTLLGFIQFASAVASTSLLTVQELLNGLFAIFMLNTLLKSCLTLFLGMVILLNPLTSIIVKWVRQRGKMIHE